MKLTTLAGMHRQDRDTITAEYSHTLNGVTVCCCGVWMVDRGCVGAK